MNIIENQAEVYEESRVIFAAFFQFESFRLTCVDLPILDDFQRFLMISGQLNKLIFFGIVIRAK